MNVQPITCPHCARQFEPSPDYQPAFCPYCGGALSLQPAPAPAPAPEPVPEPLVEPVLEQKRPAPAPSYTPEPALEQKRPFAAPARPRAASARRPTLAGWYFAVLVWAVAFCALYYAVSDSYLLYQPNVLYPTLALASFPLWFPCFHPWRRIPEKRKGVWLRWSLIMAALVALSVFLVEEVF